jgi:hypothetical protein
MVIKRLGLSTIRNEKQMNKVKRKQLGNSLILHETFQITPTWWRKTIGGERRSASSDKQFKLWKGRAKDENKGVCFSTSTRSFGFIFSFVHGKTINDKIRWPISSLRAA